MTYLPSLIKKIDDFCSLADSLTRLKRIAQDYSGGYVSPDDPEDEESPGGDIPGGPGLYQDIIGAANSINGQNEDNGDNQDVANELFLIAELYKKAIEINGGYSQVKNAMNVALSNIDSLIDDGGLDENARDIAENIIEEAASDLRQRAKVDPSKQLPEQVAIRELKAVQQAFNSQEARQEMEGQKSVYEKGKPGAETGHGIAARVPPETPQKYGREIERLQDSLANDPNLRNETSRGYVSQLVNALKGLVAQIPITIAAKDKLKVTPDDKAAQQEFQEAEAKLTELRNIRRDMTRKLNDFLRDKEIEALQQKMLKPGLTDQEKAWWGAKIKLEALRKSQDLKKGRQIKLLKDLINSTGRLDKDGDYDPLNIPDDQKRKLIEGIDQEENYQGQKVSKVSYDEKQSLERRQEHGALGDIVRRQKGRRGGGKEDSRLNQYDLDAATFNGLLDKLNEKINTSAHVARLNVTQEVDANKRKVHNGLKTYVDAVSKAIQKKDNKAKLEAIKALKAQMVEWASRAPAIKAMARNVKWLPFFVKIKNDLVTIATWKTEAGWDLNENKQAFIANVISGSQRLIQAYGRYYQGRGAPKGTVQPEIAFDNTVKYLGDVVKQLTKETGVTAATAQGKS